MLTTMIRAYREMIELEWECEVSQLGDKISSLSAKQCQSAGLSELNLEIDSTRTSLFGRCSLILRKMDKSPLKGSFKVGDEVNIYNPKYLSKSATSSTTSTKPFSAEVNERTLLFGLISKISASNVEVVLDEFEYSSAFEPPLRLDLTSSQKTYTKMKEALQSLEVSGHPLVGLLFAEKDSTIPYTFLPSSLPVLDLVWNQALNSSQLNAISTALASPKISLIHGPPGTGKTSTLTELILQAVRLDQKVLVCAPSNIAVDTILSRLADEYLSKRKVAQKANLVLNMVRLGHPARVSENAMQYSLDYQISVDESTSIVNDVRKDIEGTRKALGGRGKAKMDAATKREKRSELKALCKEAKAREKAVVEKIIKRSNVILCTCIGASSHLLKNYDFDMVVVDEAAQGIEAACWIPLLLGRKCVLAGDHCQLPPTVKSEEAAKRGLAVTLFERVILDQRFAPVVKLLDTQYRMNSLISDWASNAMYAGAIISHPDVANRTVKDLLNGGSLKSESAPEDESAEESVIPIMLLVDTRGCGMLEDAETEQGSRRNNHEADIVFKHAKALIEAGIEASQIGIITPYNGQLEALKGLFQAVEGSLVDDVIMADKLRQIEIKTIDGFQGGEKECIIISLVRSNSRREVGFLSDNRRINVGVTRAKRHLAVIGDSQTCGADPFLRSLLDHITTHGDYITGEEFVELSVAGVSPLTAASSHPRDEKASLSAYTKGQKVVSEKVKPQDIRVELTEVELKRFLELFLCGEVKQGHVQLLKDGTLFLTKKKLSYPFSAGGGRLLRFPRTFTSFQRMQIHSVCEQLQLHHRSCGEGAERIIEVCTAPFVAADEAQESTADFGSDKNQQLRPKVVSDSLTVSVSGSLIVPTVPVEKPESNAQQPPLKLEEDSATTTSGGDSKTIIGNEIKDTEKTALEESAAFLQQLHLSRKAEKERATAASVKAAVDKPKKGPKPAIVDENEDDLLDALIAENKRTAQLNQYRLSSKPLLNPEKENNKKKLHSKLEDARSSRLPSRQEADNNGSTVAPQSKKKVLKKPLPNFGGGVLGTKS